MSEHENAAAPGPSFYSRVDIFDNYPPNTVVKDIHMYNKEVFVIFTELQGAAIADVWKKLSAIGKGAEISGNPVLLTERGQAFLDHIESFDTGVPS